MASNGFSNLIDMPTRPISNSCLDHIWISNFDEAIEIMPGILDFVTPDHCPVFTTFLFKGKMKFNSDQIAYRKFSTENYNHYKNNLNSIDWSYLYDLSDVDSMIEFLEHELHGAYHSAFPINYKNTSINKKEIIG
jgi:hypothetical protein